MATDEWIVFNDRELVNLSRAAQLAEVLGIDTLWTRPEAVQWVEDATGGTDYSDITTAPWYNEHIPASAEFAGTVPISFRGLDDSTLTATTQEYLTDGGRSGKPRYDTLPIVGSVAVVASTERGALYGKMWVDKVLRCESNKRTFCTGWDLEYFDHPGSSLANVKHRRNVRTTRGATVTQKRSTDCSVTWFLSFTLTAGDPYEYGEPVPQVLEIGDGTATGPNVIASGSSTLLHSLCPEYSYEPVYDPLHPALVAPPTAPDFLPPGWGISPGMSFERTWVRLGGDLPESLTALPRFEVRNEGSTPARYVRVTLWEDIDDPDNQCDPLVSAVISYLPTDMTLYIDGEQKAAYFWDGVSPTVRRADTLVFNYDARPLQWRCFTVQPNMGVTLDVYPDLGTPADIKAAVSLIQRSD